MARTTRRQVEASVSQLRQLAIAKGVDGAEGWSLSYAPVYGGYCIQYGDGRGSLGEAFLSANRMSAGAFYQALRIAYAILERLPDAS